MSYPPQFRWTFAIASIAWFIVALDRLVVATALPAIRLDLGASQADLEWTINAYTLSFATLLLTGAALGDRFGRRRMFAIGISAFTLGSAGAALAPSIGALIAARAVQGVGGALFVPLALPMLAAVTPAARRGAVLGCWGAIGGLGAALGPLVGGVLAGGGSGVLGWRAIFWLNVPFGAALVLLIRRRLVDERRNRQRLDLVGAVLGSVSLFAVVWGLIDGSTGTWDARAPLSLTGGVLGFAMFLRWESRAAAPMLPLRLFRVRVFALVSLATLLMYAPLFGELFLITQLLQVGLGLTPSASGLHLLPMAVTPMLVVPIGGLLTDRLGGRPLMISGVAMVAVAFGWLAAVVRPGVPYPQLVPALVLAGAGSALFFAPVAHATMSSVAAELHGKAAGVTNTIRELAVVFGIAAFGAIFARAGGYDSATRFVAGFGPAAWAAAGVAGTGVLAAAALPRMRAARAPETLPRWDTEVRGAAVPAGTAS